MPYRQLAKTIVQTLFLFFLFLSSGITHTNAQAIRSTGLAGFDDNETKGGFKTDSIETTEVPEGIYAWTIGERFGDIRPANYDTIPHAFQNSNATLGMEGHYNFTGNLSAPRISRYFYEQNENMQRNPFFFRSPYDFFYRGTESLLFTNTKSPFTNLTYHSCGNKTNGEDRLKALFSVNSGKKLGMGFLIDYAYGRGYYEGQSTAHFNGTLFASYIGEKYRMHVFFEHTNLKTRENGGIENDDYVKRPEIFPTRYGTSDMPVNLSRAWNKIAGKKLYLTHRYSLGFHRYFDREGHSVTLPLPRTDSLLVRDSLHNDTLSLTAQSDSLKKLTPRLPRTPRLDAEGEDEPEDEPEPDIISEFVPVSSIIHTLCVTGNKRRFISNEINNADNPGFFRDFYLPGDSANDRTHHLGIENTVALELHEGFNRWMKMGLRLYAKHELANFDFDLPTPYASQVKTKWHENYITLGGQLLSTQSSIITYDVLGEIRTTGTDWGEFNVEGKAALNIPLKKDSLRFLVAGFVRNERPSFYYRHYYGRNAWWDNDNLDKMFHARVSGTLSYKKTSLTATLENIQNYTYLQETLEPYSNTDGYDNYRHAVSVEQASKNTQLLALTLRQDLRVGILNWNNEFTYQASTNKDVLPVPAFSAYSNLYLLFRIAHVLQTEIGVDVRYFTRYTAPTYSPIIGQYAVQDAAYSVKVGNYPIIDAYANFHLKRTRFYIKASHLNYSSGAGNPFLVPHYPLNRMTIHIGISWNFVN